MIGVMESREVKKAVNPERMLRSGEYGLSPGEESIERMLDFIDLVGTRFREIKSRLRRTSDSRRQLQNDRNLPV